MDCRTIGGITVADIDARLDAYTARQMGPALEDICTPSRGKLLLNFSRTEFISSAGLRLLIAAEKKMRESGGRCALCSLKPNVRRVFEIAGITHVFSIHDSEEEALKSFG